MRNGLFITGTDTGVGKTIVAATIAYALKQRQIDFGYIKPMESGILSDDYLARKSDAALVKKAGSLPESFAEIVPFTFPEPLAPLLAARRAGVVITKTNLINSIKKLIRPQRLTIVEGAGGLLAPLCENFLVLNLIKELNLPVLVVCRTALGSVNHTLLTLDRLRHEGIDILGVIANHTTSTPDIADKTFTSQLTEFDPAPILGELPYTADLRPDFSDWKQLAAHINIETLINLTKSINTRQ